MKKQIRLQEWTDDYATDVKDVMPVNDQEVLFKTGSGNIVEGWYNDNKGFDSCQIDWDISDEAIEWHPSKVDM